MEKLNSSIEDMYNELLADDNCKEISGNPNDV